MKTDPIPTDVPVDQALRIIRETVEPRISRVKVKALNAINKVLAMDVSAQRDVPRFDNSAMDGYVFRKEDLDKGMKQFPVKGEIRPEDVKPAALEAETCARIMTGAPVPENGTAVIPVELVVEKNGKVHVQDIPGRNPIRKRGEGYHKGNSLLKKGTIIRPYEAGLIIESGNTECEIIKPVKIGLQVTGSEIDESNDTNGPVLESLISNWPGVEITRIPVLSDEEDEVTARMQELADHFDLVLTTGGISAGKYDYLLPVMNNLNARTLIRKIQQKPGKPFTVTMIDDLFFCHLPGNPVSAVFCAEIYVRFLLFRMLGLTFPAGSVSSETALENHRDEKTLFVPGYLSSDSNGKLSVHTEARMRSHLLQLYSDQNVYVRIDPSTSYQPGEMVPVIPFSTTHLL